MAKIPILQKLSFWMFTFYYDSGIPICINMYFFDKLK